MTRTLPETNQQQTLRDIVTAVRDFIDANRARFACAPGGWADHWEKSLAFHATRGNLALIWQPGRADLPVRQEAVPHIVGCAIAWQTNAGDIYQAEHNGRSVFEWRGNDIEGDAVYLALVCTTDRRALRPLARYYLDRWPHWAGLKQFCHRRGKLRREDGLLNRLAGISPNLNPI